MSINNSNQVSHAGGTLASNGRSFWATASIGIILVGGGIITTVGCLLVEKWGQERLGVDFERRTGNFMTFLQTDAVQDYTRQNHETLDAMNAAFAEQGIGPNTLESFREHVVNSDWMWSSVALVPRVPLEDRAAFERWAASRNKGSFAVRDRSLDGNAGAPAGERAIYYPILDVVSQRPVEGLVGLDIAASETMLAALAYSEEHGAQVAVGTTEDGGELVFLHVLPLPEGLENPIRPGESLDGFAAVITHTTLGGLAEFFPLTMGGIDTYLMETPRRGVRNDEAARMTAAVREVALANHAMAGGAWIDMGGTHWGVVSKPRNSLVVLHNKPDAIYVAALGVLITSVVCMFALRSQYRARRVEALVRQRTMELSAANDELAREICEREKTETALRNSQVQYRLLSDNITDVIWTIDLDLRIVYSSPSVIRLRGYTVEEVAGQAIDEILTHESLALVTPVIADALARVAAGEVDPPPSYTLEIDMRRRDGSIVHTETTATLLLNEKKEVVGFLGVTRDIEARKRAEADKSALEAQLRQSQKMEAIGTLAGGVAHDFNNLLTGILGYANLLKLQSGADSTVFEAADVIERAAQRASELTKQLLGFARQGKLQNAPVDLNATIQESVALLRRTIDKRISIVQRLRPEGALVMGDPSQLQLVILNLAVNARDAMPDGGDMVFETTVVNLNDAYSRVHPEVRPGEYIRLFISDTGAGISPEIQERIFEPFFTTKGRGQGTGMGLATVYGIVKNHGGLVLVESKIGRGTRFEILLPVAAKDAKATILAEDEQPVRGRGKILVVEDEEVVRKLASEILNWLGYDTIVACDGVEAVEYYTDHPGDVDLALIDLNMPRMGGRECYLKMKLINPDLRAVLSTGYSCDGAAQEILDDGVQGFVQKPFQAGQLSEAIANALK